jgi:hypothetical protein
MWELKNQNIDYTIKWKLLKRAQPYNSASNRCNLCLWEKYFIISKPKMASLSKRNELVSACRHNKKFLLRDGPLYIWEGGGVGQFFRARIFFHPPIACKNFFFCNIPLHDIFLRWPKKFFPESSSKSLSTGGKAYIFWLS